jgi:hypothetical protein
MLQNLVICLKERREYAKKYGGIWVEQLHELESKIKSLLDAKSKQSHYFTKKAKHFQEGDTIYAKNDQLAAILDRKETEKMVIFEVLTQSGKYEIVRRQKLTSCCYK